MRHGRGQDRRDQNAVDGAGARIADEREGFPAAPGVHGRRAVLIGGAAVTAATAAALVGHTAATAPPARTAAPSPASGRPAAQGDHALLLQVLAHPDDDLYFMNPDTSQAVAAGIPLVCVYVTAGEADGVNKIPGRPHPRPTGPRTPPPVTRGSASPTRPSSACRSSAAGAPRSRRSRAGTRPR